MDKAVIADYQQRYDALKNDFFNNDISSLFVKLEEIVNKPKKTKKDEEHFAEIHNDIILWNEKVKTVDVLYASLTEYHPYIQSPKIFYFNIKTE